MTHTDPTSQPLTAQQRKELRELWEAQNIEPYNGNVVHKFMRLCAKHMPRALAQIDALERERDALLETLRDIASGMHGSNVCNVAALAALKGTPQ